MGYEKLIKVQQALKAPKNQRNSFGGYSYRSCEDILEAVKPLLAEQNLLLVITDEVRVIDGRFYVVATASIFEPNDDTFPALAQVRGWSREPEAKKGMDDSQITGAASSYARKYALNGLFLIDDNKDADTDEYSKSNTYSSNNKTAPKKASQVQQHFSELTRNIKKEQKQNIHLWCVAEYGEDYFSKDEALTAAIKQFALEK